MRKANSAVTPEGYPVIFLTTVCAIVFALLGCTLLAVLSLVAVWFALHFFRDPERVVPTDPDCAVSPADGKIVRIEEKERGDTRLRLHFHESLQRARKPHARCRHYPSHHLLARQILQRLPGQGLQI